MNRMTIVKKCSFCNGISLRSFECSSFQAGMEKWRAGAVIQDAFPALSKSDREFLMTGMCSHCEDTIFKKYRLADSVSNTLGF